MKVTVYSTQSCPFCTMLTQWMDDQHIEYEEYKVDQDPNRAREMIERSGQMGVPFTFIENEHYRNGVLGFDPTAIEQSMAAAGR
jgi:glutaredoxin 3